jgi:hypothetical protein
MRATSTEKNDEKAIFEQLDDDGGALIVNGMAISSDGVLYAASGAADMGIRRSIDPLTEIDDDAEPPTPTAPTFEAMAGTVGDHKFKLPGDAALQNLELLAGTNTLYAIITGQTDPVFGTTDSYVYGYGDRLVTITDILNVKPAQSSPGYAELLTTDTTATLKWGAVSGATEYEVWYSDDSAFDGLDPTAPGDADEEGVATTDETSKKFSKVLAGGTTYYWKVRVSAPTLGPWSDTQPFTTALNAPELPEVTMLPLPGASDISVKPTLRWPEVDGALTYEIEVTDDPFFTTVVQYGASLSNIYMVPKALEYSTAYYWRVRAVSDDSVSQWTVSSFTTGEEPEETEKEVETVVITEPGETKVEVVKVPVQTIVEQPIPSYLLWTIIGVGAVLIIALIVLIVRTRRVT